MVAVGPVQCAAKASRCAVVAALFFCEADRLAQLTRAVNLAISDGPEQLKKLRNASHDVFRISGRGRVITQVRPSLVPTVQQA